MQKITLDIPEMEQLREQLRRLPEPRGGRRQLHPLAALLTIVLAATLAGARGCLAMAEFAARLTQRELKCLRGYYDRGKQRFVPPSVPTPRRVLQRVDPEALETSFCAFIQTLTPTDEPIALMARR